jgi:hypothetical protein
MNDRDHATYLEIETDPADTLLHALRSRLGHLAPDDLTDSLLKVIVQVWDAEGGRDAVVAALGRVSPTSHEG